MPVGRLDSGNPFFPVPKGGFKRQNYITVCIPDVDPLPALVKEVYHTLSMDPSRYSVVYSEDSPYSYGIVSADEIKGPAIAFNPCTDFRLEADDSEAQTSCPTSPSDFFFDSPPESPERDLPTPETLVAPLSPKYQYVLFSNRRAFRPIAFSPPAAEANQPATTAAAQPLGEICLECFETMP